MIRRVQPLEDAFESIGRGLDDLMGRLTQKNYCHFSRSTAWQPAVNIYESESRFDLCVELAGMDRDRIHVEVTGRHLTIRGERPVPSVPRSSGQACVLRMEIDSGPFERVVELSEAADPREIEANYENGFLWVMIPKGRK